MINPLVTERRLKEPCSLYPSRDFVSSKGVTKRQHEQCRGTHTRLVAAYSQGVYGPQGEGLENEEKWNPTALKPWLLAKAGEPWERWQARGEWLDPLTHMCSDGSRRL